jgi:hypothetical protein
MKFWTFSLDRIRPRPKPTEGTYFFHIPKTAGMSTWQLLEWAYPPDAICPGRMWEDIISLPPSRLLAYQAFRGHFLSYLEPHLGRPLCKFTILRDPVARTVSHYRHVRRSPEHPYHPIVSAQSLADFCTDPRTQHMVVNYQAGYLFWPPSAVPSELARGMSKADFATYRLQLRLDPDPSRFPDDDELYQLAKARLATFAAVGIAENLPQSLRLIAGALGFGIPPAFERRNVAPDRPIPLDSPTERLIRARTEVDQALYDHVRSRFALPALAAASSR